MNKAISCLMASFLALCLVPLSGAERQTIVLPDLKKPDFVTIDNNSFYVVEETEISVFSLTDYKLRFKFGKKGEGPGELLPHPGFPVKVTFPPNQIMVESAHKLVFFDSGGAFIREMRKTDLAVMNYQPAGDHYVATRLLIEGKKRTGVIGLYDAELKPIRELCSQPWVEQGAEPPAIQINMGFDFPIYRAYKDRIYIEQSNRGFIIEVFDLNGKSLKRIAADIPGTPMTQAYQNKIMNRFRNDRRIKIIARQVGGIEQVYKLFTWEKPSALPPIRDMEISGDRIYIQTFQVENDLDRYIVMDLEGKILQRPLVQAFEGVPILSLLMGCRNHAIHEGRLYYFSENAETAEWSLNIGEIREQGERSGNDH